MRRIALFPVFAFLVLSLPTEVSAKTRVRDIDTSTGVLQDAAFHATCTNGSVAGANSTFNATLSRLGRVVVRISNSWDWSSYDGTDHPAALMNVTPQALESILAGCNSFGTDATVQITRLRSGVQAPADGQIVAEVTGGSVYELVVAPDPRVTAASQPGGVCPASGLPLDGTINESIVNFEADPDQPDTPRGSITGSRWASRIGRVTGTVRTLFNSCTGETSSYMTSDVERP